MSNDCRVCNNYIETFFGNVHFSISMNFFSNLVVGEESETYIVDCFRSDGCFTHQDLGILTHGEISYLVSY